MTTTDRSGEKGVMWIERARTTTRKRRERLYGRGEHSKSQFPRFFFQNLFRQCIRQWFNRQQNPSSSQLVSALLQHLKASLFCPRAEYSWHPSPYTLRIASPSPARCLLERVSFQKYSFVLSWKTTRSILYMVSINLINRGCVRMLVDVYATRISRRFCRVEKEKILS